VIIAIISAIGVFVAFLVLLIALLWIFQERIAFQPPPSPPTTQEEQDDVRQDFYRAADNQPLLAYVIGNSETVKGLLLCFHGNADLAVNGINWAKKVAQLTGFAVMLAEYRGYMNLGGHPSYLRSQVDSEAAFIHATDSLGFRHDRVALYGHSLGTAVASELAARHRPLCLMLESPFTSAQAMARIIAWRGIEIAWGVISRFRFDTLAVVASIDAPVWVAHGTSDRLIPPAMGEEVFAAARVKGQLLLVPGAAHSDVAAVGGDEYWRWIAAALAS